MPSNKIVATSTDKEAVLARLREQGIAVQADLVEQGEMAAKREAWKLEDFANRWLLIDTTSVTIEQFTHKQSGEVRDGLHMTVTDPETGETNLFLASSDSILAWYHDQFMSMQSRPPQIAVFVEAVPHSTRPGGTVYNFK